MLRNNIKSLKKVVRCRPVEGGEDTWEMFMSQHDAARVLNARFPDREFKSSHIQESARAALDGKKRKTASGWVFEYV